MLLTEYRPRPALTTKVTTIAKPRFPVIDAHNHLAEPMGLRAVPKKYLCPVRVIVPTP